MSASIILYPRNSTAERRQQIRDWRDAAIADGWDHAPIYPNHEPEETAVRMNRSGFVAQICMRPTYYSLHVWCPRGMALEIPIPYSWEQLELNRKLCETCGGREAEIDRVGFANRICVKCAPVQRKKIEFPGWDN